MSDLEGKFFTRGNMVVEKLERGIHHWFSRPDVTGSKDLIVVRVEVGPGGGHPFHIHPDMDEVIYILSGTAEQWIEQEKKLLNAGESVFVPKKMVHATYNATDESLTFLAILGPAADLEGSMVYVDDREPWASLKD
ncbi:MAG: cupin domain-containing protein [Bacteroidetes bacterium]|jgi:quercetin dioxygenase-like cupin family protein|nr:cupin domain-containing protein [Bacteroidota bacterium]